MNSTAPICCTLSRAGPSHGSETDGTKNSTEPFADNVMLFPQGKEIDNRCCCEGGCACVPGRDCGCKGYRPVKSTLPAYRRGEGVDKVPVIQCCGEKACREDPQSG